MKEIFYKKIKSNAGFILRSYLVIAVEVDLDVLVLVKVALLALFSSSMMSFFAAFVLSFLASKTALTLSEPQSRKW